MVGFIKLLTGDLHRDALYDADFVFATDSKTTHLAAHIVFSAVMADAAMVEHVVSMDAQAMPTEHYAAAAAGGRRGLAQQPATRDIEGRGGVFWYELRG